MVSFVAAMVVYFSNVIPWVMLEVMIVLPDLLPAPVHVSVTVPLQLMCVLSEMGFWSFCYPVVSSQLCLLVQEATKCLSI